MKKIKSFLSNSNFRNSYIIIGILALVSYYFVQKLFTDTSAFGYILSSQLTFNLIIMFGLWGGLHHLIIKVKNPYLDKVVLVVGFIIIVLILRIFGMKTIFG
jgi:hypothetical protein